MKTKSVNSIPTIPPAPAPAMAMADGADQVPSFNLATITPEPALPENRKPAFKIVMIANPLALFKTSGGMTWSAPKTWFGLTKLAKIFAAFLY